MVRGRSNVQISIRIKRHAALRAIPILRPVCAPRFHNAHLDGEECLVNISWVSLEEARQKLEISAWGIDAIKLACPSEVGNIPRA